MNSQTYPAQYLNVRELFEGRFFVIPDYQRGYSWGEENVRDLLTDIERAGKRALLHYTGTIVAKHQPHSSTFEVVDGQQRLTTILLIMTKMAEVFNEKADEIRERYIFRGGKGNESLVVEPNAEIRAYFRKRVLNNQVNEPKRVAGHHAIDAALTVVESWLQKNVAKAADFFETIEERLRFLLFVPPSNQEAGAMFEVINNRGVGLSQLQMVKNYLLYFATIHDKKNLREQINEIWQALLHSLDSAGIDSADSEDQFLRNCYLVYFDTNKSKSWDAYTQIKEWYPVDTDEVDEITQEFSDFVLFLEKAARFVAALRNAAIARDTFSNNNVQRELKRLRCHPSLASFLPMIISVIAKIDDQKKLAEVLSLIERINFRVYLLPRVTNRSDSGQGQLFSWAFGFYNDGITLRDLKKQLLSWARSHSNVKTVAEHLTLDDGETEDYYSWPALRYFLARYEEYLEAGHADVFDVEQILKRRDVSLSGEYLSVEHIWAQNNRANSYSPDYITKRRLGNLVLLALNENIKASDADIADKVDKLIDHAEHGIKLDQVVALRKVLKQAQKNPAYVKYKNRVDSKYAVLAQAVADLRENELVRFAIQEWALPGDDPEQFIKVDSLSDPKRITVCWFKEE